MFRSILAAAIAATLWVFSPGPFTAADASEIQVVSFNIQFLGNSRNRRNCDLADMLAPYDLVFIQELVAPPYPGTFPDGSAFKPDKEAKAFFEAMNAHRFSYVLCAFGRRHGNRTDDSQ